MTKLQIKRNGFSLIELVLYIFIFFIILVALVALFQEVILLKAKINNKTEITDNGQFALKKMTWYIQQAESINNPTPGQTSDTLSLNTDITSDNPVVFFVEDNSLKMKKGSQPAYELTNNQVIIDQLNFTNRAFVGGLDIIQINMDLISAISLWQNSAVSLQTSVKIEE